MRKLTVVCVLAAFFAAWPVESRALPVTISDGSLSVTVNGFGEFHEIFLNGTPIDSSLVVQSQTVTGWSLEGTAGPVLSPDGRSATYSATARQGRFAIEVESTILGPLADHPSDTGVLQETFSITETDPSAILTPLDLTSTSFIDPNLEGSGLETVDFDAARQVLYAIDGPLLFAAIVGGGDVRWEFGADGFVSRSYDNLENTPGGPFGPASVDMALGVDTGPIGFDETRSITFRYLFSTGNLSAPPEEFTFVPEPGTATLLGLGLIGLAKRRRRHGARRHGVWQLALLLLSPLSAAAQVPAVAYDVVIDSPVPDNASGAPTTAIAATVFVPEHASGATYPLILHSHGWGGDRVTEADTAAPFDTSRFYSVALDSQVGPLWQAGYAVVSFDERGFHDSGGAIRVMDPDFEIQDAIAVLDWAEANLDLARDAGGDPYVGAIGGSYGGGFQLLLAALDPRIDAITPSATWYDLPNSLVPDGVIQKLWVNLLCVSAVAAGDRTFSDDLTQACQEAGYDPSKRFIEELDPTIVDFLGGHGMGAFQARHEDPEDPFTMRPVDVLLTQGQRDLLFPLNEALANDRFLSALGGDVRLITHQHGHILGPPFDGQAPLGAMRCGTLDTLEALQLWFAEKLKGVAGAADAIPRVCIGLDDIRGAALDEVPIADGTHVVAIPQTTILAVQNNYGGSEPTFFPLGAPIDRDDLILAGIPLADLSIDPLVPGTDVVAFVAVGVQSVGEGAPRVIDDQVTPLRDGQVSAAELFGVGEMLRDGDQVGVLLYGDIEGFNNSGKTAWLSNSYTIGGSVALPVPEPGQAESLAGAMAALWGLAARRSRRASRHRGSGNYPSTMSTRCWAPSSDNGMSASAGSGVPSRLARATPRQTPFGFSTLIR